MKTIRSDELKVGDRIVDPIRGHGATMEVTDIRQKQATFLLKDQENDVFPVVMGAHETVILVESNTDELPECRCKGFYKHPDCPVHGHKKG